MREELGIGTSARPASQILLVVVAYYLLPVYETLSNNALGLRIVATVATLGLLVWAVARRVMREVRGDGGNPERLVLAVVLGVTVFAVADFVVARAGPGQFVGLETKTDALYFALTTLTTVGFGDVYAAGQVARALVVVQLLFNVVVLASAARVLTDSLGRHRT